ncbi:MAG TPA: pirin family protein [Gammaproteobacteria bacterium]|nr:pirin family protein [Gammaproteobacteria bacterium]
MEAAKTIDGERAVIKTVRGRPTSDGAGVRLNRMMGTPQLPDLDPFLMLDEFRSDDANDYIAGFPNHPHRGFETVTYMLAGRMRHGDNQGNSGLLTAGSVQWMTAGRGIVHSEMPEQEDGLMWGFQLWVNLPAKDKMTAPRYQDIGPEAIPVVEVAMGVRVKVVAGEVNDARGPVSAVATEPVYLDIELQPGAEYVAALPPGHNAFAYVYAGAADIGTPAERTASRELAVLEQGGDSVHLAAVGDVPARLLLVAGRPLGEPVARYGPFVMNTTEQLHEAVADFQAGRL